MILKTTISEEEGKQFIEGFNNSGHSSRSSYLRQIVNNNFIKTQNIEPKINKFNDEDYLKEENFPVRINKYLKDKADKRAGQYGLKRSQWIRNLIQANLTKEPVLLEKPINELRAANRELAAIGRNINQLTKILNRSIELDFKDEINQQHLIDITNAIKNIRSYIDRLVKLSNGVWEIKEWI